MRRSLALFATSALLAITILAAILGTYGYQRRRTAIEEQAHSHAARETSWRAISIACDHVAFAVRAPVIRDDSVVYVVSTLADPTAMGNRGKPS